MEFYLTSKILESDPSSTPFTPEDFLGKIFGNFWSFLINFIALIILFVVVFFLAYKPVRQYVQKRKEYINHSIHDAEVAKDFYEKKVKESDEVVARANKSAQEIIAKAEQDASSRAMKIIEKADIEASNRKKEADEAIKLEEKKSRQAIHDEIVNVAMEASKELLKRKVTSADDKRLLEEFANELDKRKEER